jgi:glycosyltransferase involved in cell wall biosynthesis
MSIDPPVSALPRPFWSVMIPAYRDRGFLRFTLESVLQQDPGPDDMQIEVVDDCAPDNPPEVVVRELAPERISFHRNPKNLGIYENWNECIRRARGHWVHILHDDDLVLPGFYARVRAAIEGKPELGAVLCRTLEIDEHGGQRFLSPLLRETPGIIEDWPACLSTANPVQFPGMVVRRVAYQALGGFDPTHGFTADWVMWVRIAALYPPIYYVPEPLACYRRHASQETSLLVRSGGDIAAIHNALNIFLQYLPKTLRSQTLNYQAREHMATVGLHQASERLAAGDLFGGLSQLREALSCSQSPRIIRVLESGLMRHFDASVERVSNAAARYRQNRADQFALDELRKTRMQLAEQWFDFAPEQLETLHSGELGSVQRLIIESGIGNEPLTEAEQDLLARLLSRPRPAAGVEGAQPTPRRLLEMLYGPVARRHLTPEVLPHSQAFAPSKQAPLPAL